MIQSMTGFGKSNIEFSNKKICIEIKSLNSKQLDLNTRLPNLYREKELAIRNILSKEIERGKVDIGIYVDNLETGASSKLNVGAIESYLTQIQEISTQFKIETPADWFATILRLPETIKTESAELDADEWETVQTGIESAVKELQSFRKQEGAMLEKLFEEKISNIERLLSSVSIYESERVERIRTRILDSLKKLDVSSLDHNRFEQELIYYIEKLDINEEKTRLKNHLDYFLETMRNENAQGRKLGFIVQEMGREINTLGSKSNHAEMQKIVVQMKDELEQIKEQILNVL